MALLFGTVMMVLATTALLLTKTIIPKDTPISNGNPTLQPTESNIFDLSCTAMVAQLNERGHHLPWTFVDGVAVAGGHTDIGLTKAILCEGNQGSEIDAVLIGMNFFKMESSEDVTARALNFLEDVGVPGNVFLDSLVHLRDNYRSIISSDESILVTSMGWQMQFDYSNDDQIFFIRYSPAGE